MGHAWHEITVSLFYNNVLNWAEFRRSKKETESEYNLCSSFVSLPCYDVLLWYTPEYNLQPNTISPGNMQPNISLHVIYNQIPFFQVFIHSETISPGMYTTNYRLSRYIYNQIPSLEVYMYMYNEIPFLQVNMKPYTVFPDICV